MRWLLVEMWAYLGIAFVLGMAAYRWIFGGGGALSAEDLSAELASVRTRYEERESERRRLSARIAELTAQLEDARREARSNEAEAHAARLELSELKTAAGIAARAANRRELEARAFDAEPDEPFGFGDDIVEPPAEPAAPVVIERAPETPAESASDATAENAPEAPASEPESRPPEASDPQVSDPPIGAPSAAAPQTSVPETATPAAESMSFMAALREGAPDDLTRIKGIGQKLEGTLNGLGVYYYRQIADWTDADVVAMDAKLKFPGRIERDKWRIQARRLLGREDGPPPPAEGGSSV